MKTEYDKQAEQFLIDTQTEIFSEFLRNGKFFYGDKEPRDIYKVTIKRGERSFSFDFGQSTRASGQYKAVAASLFVVRDLGLVQGQGLTKDEYIQLKRKIRFQPLAGQVEKNQHFEVVTDYDVLSCLTKHDPGTFDDFCGDLGYDTDSRKAESVYNEVVKEYQNVCMLWNESELEQLREIN